MLEIFHYSFMIRALIAGILVALAIPVLGCFLVARRYALIGDSLAHVSLAGVGAGLLLQASPLLVALPVTIVGALLIEYLRQNKKLTGDTSLALLMSGGLALAIVLTSISGGTADFSAYLFGSITTTTAADLRILLVSVLVVLGAVALGYQTLLHIAFDEDSARIANRQKVTIYNYLLIALTAAMVVLCLRIIGGLLVSALIVVPVVTAGGLARSFAQTMVFAVITALIGVIAGLVLAFYVGVAAGGAIVLVTLGLFAVSLAFRKS